VSTAIEPGTAQVHEPVEPATSPHTRSEPRSAARTYRPLRLTIRGAVVGIVVVSLLSTLPAVWFGVPVVSGLGFLAVGTFTALFIRRRDLLSLSVCPPAAYLAGALVATLLAAEGEGFLRGLVLPLAILLADAAPWLFFGTAAVLVIALFRGLPQSIRRFRRQLRGEED
jgi:hypothetical protein